MGKRVNTTVAERKALLKELGYTEADMQRFWDECIPVNSKIRMLSEAGHNWTNLCAFQMRELPTLKETTLKQLEEKHKKEEEERLEREKIRKEKKYYIEHFEEIILNKIDNKEKLTEAEIRELVFEYEHERKDSASVHKKRRSVETIIRLLDRYFCINWIEDLNEWGEHEFDNQPYEVEMYEYEKTIIVKEWRKK